MPKAPLTVLLASPRGFCAGVDRAIQIVEAALERRGAPVYVRHEIVHNRTVVAGLEQKGAVFVDQLDEVPDGALVIFSAHGVAKAVPAEAARRGLEWLDATCPLVSKVHREAEAHHEAGRLCLLIGHAGHPEVIGTMGQLPNGAVLLVENVAAAESLVPGSADLAYLTQTTLSVDDAAEIIAVLERRFPAIQAPTKEDICYATTNRQRAVRQAAERADVCLVVGAPNSSNSLRLVEMARRHGCPRAELLESAADLDWALLDGAATVALSAGASAPEHLVEELLAVLSQRFEVSVELVEAAREDVRFKLPLALTA
jgi:4-hydroxy-3-methylbut-2-enyl diphosphate reductase